MFESSETDLLPLKILVHFSLLGFVENTVSIQIIFCENSLDLSISMPAPKGNKIQVDGQNH